MDDALAAVDAACDVVNGLVEDGMSLVVELQAVVADLDGLAE